MPAAALFMPRKTKKEMVAYIIGHEMYWVMNNWNGLIGYSRCIKIHRLPLTGEEMDRAFEIICDENLSEELWEGLQILIEEFQGETGISVYTNGCSGGYLVMESRLNESIRNGFPVWSEEDLREMSYEEVEKISRTLKQFDRMFDDMVRVLKHYCSLEIGMERYVVVRKRKVFKKEGLPERRRTCRPVLRRDGNRRGSK